MSPAVETYNENQRKAVSWNCGPLLVLSGPGSGKTWVLAHRVARILKEDADAWVLALTCSDRAVANLQERVNRLTGQRADRARLRTFRSFAVDILRQHSSHLGLRPNFSLLIHDEDRIAILENVVAELPDEGGPLPADRRNLLRFVDRLFAESYNGGGKAAALARLPTWASTLHRSYCEALVCENCLDFSSLPHFACRLLKEKPGVARLVRLGWTHVCVDEFHDANNAQYDFLWLIVPDRRHDLFVVGDDEQDHPPMERRKPRTAREAAAGLRYGRRSISPELSVSDVNHGICKPVDCTQRRPIAERACLGGFTRGGAPRQQCFPVQNL